MNRRAGVGRDRGFTLLEMLVTLSLLAMVSAVIWQAMHQVLRVEQLMQSSGVEGQLGTVRREWVRGLIEAALPETFGAPRRFVGDERQLTLASAEALNLPGLRSAEVVLRIESDTSGDTHRLILADKPAAAGADLGQRVEPEGHRIELLSWHGRAGSLRYLDFRGQWQDHWPLAPEFTASQIANDDDLLRAARAALPRLPRAVWLDLGPEAGGPLVSTVSVTEAGRPSLAQWEKL
jgi:prepilin-type N-terminal cleavage/methylation domain-containing protein